MRGDKMKTGDEIIRIVEQSEKDIGLYLRISKDEEYGEAFTWYRTSVWLSRNAETSKERKSYNKAAQKLAEMLVEMSGRVWIGF